MHIVQWSVEVYFSFQLHLRHHLFRCCNQVYNKYAIITKHSKSAAWSSTVMSRLVICLFFSDLDNGA
jgi:hypothetical protein